jgi:UDP-glucuronate decarboxylase
VVRWISDRLGTAAWDDPGTAGAVVVDVRDLLDRAGNAADAVAARIEGAVRAVREGGRVVICCDHGMSRSNAVAAGVLARLEGISFDEAARRVVNVAGATHVKSEMLTTVRSALGEIGMRREPGERPGVLVTGGSGFVGRALLERASDRWEVSAPNRREIDLLEGSAALSLALRATGAGTLVHLANPRIPADIGAMGASITMLESVLDACAAEDVRLVYLSGWMVYSGYREDRLLASESFAPNSRGVYGETKELAETLIRLRTVRNGTRAAIVRPSMLYGGTGEKPRFLYRFLQRALEGQEIVTHRYRNGRPQVDLLHVDDLARLLVAVVESEFTGALNAGSGAGIGTTELARRIAALTGAEVPIRQLGLDDVSCALLMDNRLAASTFGWSPQIEIGTGLRRLVNDYRSQWDPNLAGAAAAA